MTDEAKTSRETIDVQTPLPPSLTQPGLGKPASYEPEEVCLHWARNPKQPFLDLSRDP